MIYTPKITFLKINLTPRLCLSARLTIFFYPLLLLSLTVDCPMVLAHILCLMARTYKFLLKCNGVNGSLLYLLESYLTDRQQQVVLDGKSSNWNNIRAGVPHGLVLGPLLFLINNNDLLPGLHTDVKLFADDMSPFSFVDNIDKSAFKLSSDLIRIHDWVYKWKLSFDPDKAKPTQEVKLSQKTKNITYPIFTLRICQLLK